MTPNQQQKGYPIFGGFPGQRETRRSDSRSDFDLPLKQWAGVIVLATLSFLLVVANVLIIGPLVGYVAGIVTFAVIALYGYAIVHEQRQPIPALVAVVSVALLGFWILAGYGIADRWWWDARCEWETRNKLLFVSFSGIFLICTFLPIYRFAQEVVDPNWSPTITIRPAEWGILWPWARIPDDDVEPEVIEIEREVVRDVPRPYQVQNENGSQKLVDNLDASRVDRGKTVIAPSGNEVSVKNLVDFVKFAPVYGATFRPWKNRGWKHEQWKDVVRVWQVYGVVSANGERTTTELIITDLREALTRLSSAFD